MNIGKSLLAACTSAIAITLLFAWLPNSLWNISANRPEVPVFQSEPLAHLSNSNLVDVLMSITLQERIGKVEWSNAVLSVELRVNPSIGRPESWFNDVERIIGLSFNQLNNVKRVLIRIVESEAEGGRLLAAVDVRSTDSWLQRDLLEFSDADPVHDEIWRKRMRLSHTSAWEEHFGRIKGFTTHSSTDPVL